MPRSRKPAASPSGPNEDDLAQFRAALGPLVSDLVTPPLPAELWARLSQEVVFRGYTLVVSPALGGRAYKIRMPMGEKGVEVYCSEKDSAEIVLGQLLTAVRTLPKRE